MAANNQTAVQASDFEADYLNYLSSEQNREKLLVVETLSQRNQLMAKPSGPCACDGCNFQPPTPDFKF